MADVGSSIGVTLWYRDPPIHIVSSSVPTSTTCAQQTEVLGPTLAALIMATM